MRSAMYWSSEMVLRNELLAGCGAAVRKLMSAGWPPSTFGMRDAGEDGEVLAVVLEDFEVRRRRVVRAGLRGKELTRQQAEVVADREHAARNAAQTARGPSLGPSHSNGSARPTPTPRSSVRREMARCGRSNLSDFDIWHSGHLILEEIALDDPVNDVADPVTGASRFLEDCFHLFAISEKPIGAPVA